MTEDNYACYLVNLYVKSLCYTLGTNVVCQLYFDKKLINIFLFSFNHIILKFYDGDKYYQFNFVFNSNYCKMLKIRLENRIVVCDVYVENFLFKMKGVATKENNFYKFLEILSDVKMEDLDYVLRDDF